MAVTQKLSDAATVDNADATVLVSGNPIIISKIIAGTDVKPAMLVVSETNAYDVGAPATTKATGVALEDPTKDIDTDFADNSPVRVAILGSNCICRTFCGTEGDATIEEGEIVYLSDDASGYWFPAHVSGHVTANEPLTPALLNSAVGRNAKRMSITDGDTFIGWLMLSI
jgi:hypothetical protein